MTHHNLVLCASVGIPAVIVTVTASLKIEDYGDSK